MTTYVGVNDRFKEEVAKNTRQTKESLSLIRDNINLIQTNISLIQAATQQYNTNEQFVLLDTATITLPANTYHSYTFVIVSGTVDITESGVTLSDAGEGLSGESTATTLLSNSITFVGQEVGTKVLIKTLR